MNTTDQTEQNKALEKQLKLKSKILKLTPSELEAVLARILPSAWAQAYRYIEGAPWSFEGREFMIAPHNILFTDDFEEMVLMTCAQIGKTNCTMDIAFFDAEVHGRSSFFMFPTNQVAWDFSKGKLNQAIFSSPLLMAFFSDINNAGHKRAGDVEFFIRGSCSSSGDDSNKFRDAMLQNVTADNVWIDEEDRCSEKSIDTVKHRRSGKEVKKFGSVSTPTIPNYGIGKRYEQSDARSFHVECPGCRKAQVMEFPANIEWRETPRDERERWGSARYKCAKCGKAWEWNLLRHIIKESALTGPDFGWIPAHPNREAAGFGHISHMYSPRVKPRELAKQWERAQGVTSKIENFWRYVMGQPYIGEGAQITKGLIDALKMATDFKMRSSSSMAFMGVDVQKANLYVDISEYDRGSGGLKRLIRPCTVRNFAELETLMTQYRIIRAVIDGAYDHRKVREFQNTFQKGRVWAAWYTLVGKRHVHFDAAKGDVNLNRTFWLDTMFGRYKLRRVLLPRDLPKEYEEHITKLIRVAPDNEESEDDEEKKYPEYKKIGKDDFCHASLYCEVAAMGYKGRSRDERKEIEEPVNEGVFELW